MLLIFNKSLLHFSFPLNHQQKLVPDISDNMHQFTPTQLLTEHQKPTFCQVIGCHNKWHNMMGPVSVCFIISSWPPVSDKRYIEQENLHTSPITQKLYCWILEVVGGLFLSFFFFFIFLFYYFIFFFFFVQWNFSFLLVADLPMKRHSPHRHTASCFFLARLLTVNWPYEIILHFRNMIDFQQLGWLFISQICFHLNP